MAARLSVLVLLLLACSGDAATPKTGPGSVALGKDPYVAGLLALGPLEADALAAVAAQTGDAFTTDEALIAALEGKAIPGYRAYLEGVKKLPTPGAERTPLHEKLVVLAGAELAALESLAAAVKQGDGFAVLEVNREQRRIAEEMDALTAAFTQGAAGNITPSKSANEASR